MSDQNNHPDTPNIPSSSAVLAIQSSILIDAPIQDVWSALTDTSTYPKWNRFVPRVTIREQPGSNNADDTALKAETRFTFHVNMYPEAADKPQPELSSLRDTFLEIIEFEPPTTSTTDTEADVEADSGALSTGKTKRKGRIVWASDPAANGALSSLLTAERVHEVSEVIDENGKQMTEVRNWESQVGYLAYVVKWMFGGRLRGNFAHWQAGLKGYMEGREGSTSRA
ncbi:hypothetical protein BDW62DRAFT_173374 [Aspergillus aurantiobrunneus]